jgi:tetratricopeptide (TPR) repeat protein
MKKNKSFLILIILIACFSFQRSNAQATFEQAMKYKAESKFPEAFAILKDLVNADSDNVEYLHNLSFLYSKLGYRQADEKEKITYYKQAEYLAKKAIEKNNSSAGAHYSYALALGRMNENAGNKQKIANAKLIKTECDLAVKLDPRLAGAYHILGRWHREIAGFNAVEKLMINTLFGGVPQGGSYDAAIESFQKSIQLEPKYSLHYYELALTYYDRNNENDKTYAKVWLQKALEIPILNEDDQNTHDKCEELLRKVE